MSGDIFLEYVIQNVILVICLDGNKGYKSCQKPILILWPPAGEPNVAINFVLPNSFLIFASVKRKMDGGAAVEDVLSSGVLKRFPTCGRISIREVKNTEMSFSPWHLTGVSVISLLLLWGNPRSSYCDWRCDHNFIGDLVHHWEVRESLWLPYLHTRPHSHNWLSMEALDEILNILDVGFVPWWSSENDVIIKNRNSSLS